MDNISLQNKQNLHSSQTQYHHGRVCRWLQNKQNLHSSQTAWITAVSAWSFRISKIYTVLKQFGMRLNSASCFRISKIYTVLKPSGYQVATTNSFRISKIYTVLKLGVKERHKGDKLQNKQNLHSSQTECKEQRF